MIKCLLLLFILVAVSLAWIGDDGHPGGSGAGNITVRSNDVILTPIGTFSVPAAAQMLGMDYLESDPHLAIMDNTSNMIRGIVPGSGTEVWNMNIPYSDTYGICQTGGPENSFYANSWSTSDIYRWDPDNRGWSVAFPDPAQSLGRGMDFDVESSCIWEIDTSGGFYRIDESGSYTYYDLSYALGWISDIALFPYGDDLGIAMIYYDFFYFNFYSFDGTDITFLGEGHIFVTDFTDSYGIAYNPATDTFFWNYVVYPSTRLIMEFDYEIQTASSLNQTTWGSIKTRF